MIQPARRALLALVAAQIRSEMRTDGPKGATSKIELVDVAGR